MSNGTSVGRISAKEKIDYMTDDIRDTIGDTLDALVRPQTVPSPDGVLRVAVLRSGDTGEGLAEYAKLTGLRVVYVNQSEEVGDISDQSVIPPFDLALADVPTDGWEGTFGFVLRFLRVRRPVAFILASRCEIGTEFLRTIQDRTRGLGYCVDGNSGFVVGTLWQDAFIWPTELTSQMVLEQVARGALAHTTD